jgi:hypothetical protein
MWGLFKMSVISQTLIGLSSERLEAVLEREKQGFCIDSGRAVSVGFQAILRRKAFNPLR